MCIVIVGSINSISDLIVVDITLSNDKLILYQYSS